MSTVVKLKRSTVTDAVPADGTLAAGELAINTTDKKVWVGTGGEVDAPVLLVDYDAMVGGAVEDINGLSGSVDVVAGNGIVVDVTTNNTIIITATGVAEDPENIVIGEEALTVSIGDPTTGANTVTTIYGDLAVTGTLDIEISVDGGDF